MNAEDQERANEVEPAEVTRLLQLAEHDADAADRLLPLVYEELRQMARRRMANEPAGHTLQATALVHEAYLRLVGGADVQWENRRHFFGAAAQAMRRILIERARRYARLKRGGDREREVFDENALGAEENAEDLLALNEALEALQKKDPRMAQIVMLRFFAGLGVEETALAMELSERTVKREWSVARLWLHERMRGEEAGEVDGD